MSTKSRISRLARTLRSPRLAVSLIAGVIGWSVLGTLVPQRDIAGPKAVEAWDAARPLLGAILSGFGLHQAYASPLFLALVAVLGVTTTVCAWDRTRSSVRRLARLGAPGEGTARRVRERPALVVPLEAGREGAQALDAVELALGRKRLRVIRQPAILSAYGGRWGLLGSPVFHWSLALLFAVIALGQLSRAQGPIGVPVGGSAMDADASYRTYSRGPLYPGHSGLRLSASDLVFDYRDPGGQARGPAPVIAIYQGSRRLVSQRVYPNSPLRYKQMFVHMSTYGLWAVFSLESTAGQEIARTGQPVDFDATAPSGTITVHLTTTKAGKPSAEITAVVPLDRAGSAFAQRMPAHPVAELRITPVSGSPTSTLVRLGESVTLPVGRRLKFERLGYYVRLSVVDDWSVYPIYALFAIAGIAISVALLVPARTVWVLLAEDGGNRRLHVLTWHARRDTAFASQIEAIVREAAACEPSKREQP